MADEVNEPGTGRTGPADTSVAEAATVPVPKRTDPTDAPAAIGENLGRYVVLEEVGRGGMGRVLRAYDPKLQREVAIKEVRPQALDEDSRARLVAEARAMAKLSHPNVVAVYDVEEPEGPGEGGRDRWAAQVQLVLVMEYVAGQTLRSWQRERKHGWQEIVARYREAGRGLVAAHDAGLLHRDFKPANVLVSSEGLVKVTDFGLAKVTVESSPSSGEATMKSGEELTVAGTVVGTPRYMAPEQHLARELTAAADQYGFCVSLWEALCGAPPFASKSTHGLVVKKRAGPPKWIEPGVPWPIVEALRRGLSVEPEGRWPSMQDLLGVLAWDPTRRRNRWLLSGATIALVGLASTAWRSWVSERALRCTGAPDQLAGIWDEARRAEIQQTILGTDKPYATLVWKRTATEIDRYAAEWTAMHTEACEATTVRGEQSTAVMDLRMACLHRAAVELGAVAHHLADADADVVRKAHRLTDGLRPLARCADVEALQEDSEPPLPDDAEAVEHIRVLLAEARAAQKVGRYAHAKEKVDAANARLAEVEYGPVETEVTLAEGDVLEELGEYEAAETTLKRALEMASRRRQWGEMRAAASELLLVIGNRQHRPAEGIQYADIARGLARGEPHREAMVANSIAAVLEAQGKNQGAEAEYRRALALLEKTLGPDHPRVATVRNGLANALTGQGKHAESEAEHRRGLAVLERALGPDHPEVAVSRNNLAIALFNQGKNAEAEAEYRQALAVLEQSLSPEHPYVPMLRANLANTLAAQGKHAEAELEYREALALEEQLLGADHPGAAQSRVNLASVLYAEKKYVEAEAEYRQALAVLEEQLSPEHPMLTQSWTNLADLLVAQGHPAEAVLLAERAFNHQQRDDIPPEYRAWTAYVLARALWTTSRASADRTRARALAQQALEHYTTAGDKHVEVRLRVEAWLEKHDHR